jgi:hypothetical protein
MKLGLENRKQAITAAILAPIALVAIYIVASQFISFGSSKPAPPSPAPVTQPQNAAANTAAQNTQASRTRERLTPLAAKQGSPYDPTLHPELMLAAEHLEYTGSGRNIFSATSAPVVVNIPKPVASARNNAIPVTIHAAPAGPPPVPFKLFGMDTHPDGKRLVFLQHNEDVFMAQVGDVVMRQYKVTRITANSVEIEDLPNNNKQVLPLLK